MSQASGQIDHGFLGGYLSGLRGNPTPRVFKTENSFTLFLIAGDKKASLNKIKKTLNIKDASMASANEVKNITGFTIGGVAPVGHLTKVNTFIDNSLERFKDLFAAAGHPNWWSPRSGDRHGILTNANHSNWRVGVYYRLRVLITRGSALQVDK